jgi:hypothetical protein
MQLPMSDHLVCRDGLGPDDDMLATDPTNIAFVVYPHNPSIHAVVVTAKIDKGLRAVFNGKRCPSVGVHNMNTIVSSRALTPAELEQAWDIRSKSEHHGDENKVYYIVPPLIIRNV